MEREIDKKIRKAEEGLAALNSRIRSQLQGADRGLFDAKEQIKNQRFGNLGAIAAEMEAGPLLGKLHDNMDEVLQNMRESSLHQLRISKERISTMQQFVDANYGENDKIGELLRNQLTEMAQHVNTEVRDRLKITNRLEAFIDRNAVDITSIVSGLASNNPLVTLATKFMLDQWRERRRKREEERTIGIQMDEEIKAHAELQRLQLIHRRKEIDIAEKQARREALEAKLAEQEKKRKEQAKVNQETSKISSLVDLIDKELAEDTSEIVEKIDEGVEMKRMDELLASIRRSTEQLGSLKELVQSQTELIDAHQDMQEDFAYERVREEEQAENKRNESLIEAIKAQGSRLIGDETGGVRSSFLDKIDAADDLFDIFKILGFTGLAKKIGTLLKSILFKIPFVGAIIGGLKTFFTVGFPQMLSKIGLKLSPGILGKMLVPAIGRIAGSVLGLAVDGVLGIMNSDEWGTSKLHSFIGGALGGTISNRMMNTIVNMGKWAAIGGTIGLAGGPVGVLVGALLGGVLGSVLGWIGGERIAKNVANYDSMLRDWADGVKQSINLYIDENFGDIKQVFIEIMDLVSQFFTELWTEVKNMFDKPVAFFRDEIIGGFFKNGRDMASSFGNTVSNTASGIAASGSSIWDKITGTLFPGTAPTISKSKTSPLHPMGTTNPGRYESKPSLLRPGGSLPLRKTTAPVVDTNTDQGGAMLQAVAGIIGNITPPLTTSGLQDPKNMSTSDAGIDFLKTHEGFRTTAYRDAGGWSIGYGHYGAKEGDTITEPEAEALFKKDIKKFEDAVRRLITVPLSQNEFDALVSFTYNTGEKSLANIARRLNTGDRDAATSAMKLYNKSLMKNRETSKMEKMTNPALVRRRSEEVEMFQGPVDSASLTPNNISPKGKVVSLVSGKQAVEGKMAAHSAINTVIAPNTTNFNTTNSTTQYMPVETRNSESTHRRISEQHVVPA